MINDKRTMACHTTPRLDALIKILNTSKSVADIGCDHAYLPILLSMKDKSKKIIAADIGEGPLMRAKNNVERFGLGDKIELRLGNGLCPIAPGETDAIVIAGMGANVICDILSRGEQVAKKASIIALQPMTGAHDLRRYLYENGYIIEKEVLVREDRRIYTIIVTKCGNTKDFSDADCYISRALRESGDKLYEEYLARQKLRIKKALDGMKSAKGDVALKNYHERVLSELEKF